MEDMKAVYRLNEEKLDFNTKVLTERATVNKKTSLLLRLRKRRFQDIVREVKRKYKEELAEFQRENVKSTEEFKNFTKMFKELQKKYERFEKSDNNRISEVWQMNEQEAKAIVEKIIQADKVIHSQQLNIEWKPPTDPIFAQFNDGQIPGANTSGTGADNTSFKGADSNNQGNSIVHQSLQDSNNSPDKADRSKSELNDE